MTESAPEWVPENPLLWTAVAEGTHSDPHALLGIHTDARNNMQVLRVRAPKAHQVIAEFPGGERIPMAHAGQGIWQSPVPASSPEVYRLIITEQAGRSVVLGDPYRHSPTIDSSDAQLLSTGAENSPWLMLGAHPGMNLGELGTGFRVWAPHARALRVEVAPPESLPRTWEMRRIGTTDIWEIFVPGIPPRSSYSWHIQGRDGRWQQRQDPAATRLGADGVAEVDVTSHQWRDAAWLTRRVTMRPHTRPVVMGELDLATWVTPQRTDEAHRQLFHEVVSSGMTHLLLHNLRHPHHLFAPNPNLGDPDLIRSLIDRLHRAGVAVLMNWTLPVPMPDSCLYRFDGEPLYEDSVTGALAIQNPTARAQTIASALFWIEQYHLDGLRLIFDAPAARTGTPLQVGRRISALIREITAGMHQAHPGVTLISPPVRGLPATAPVVAGGLGFDYVENDRWVRDTHRVFAHEARHATDLPSTMRSAWTQPYSYGFEEKYLLPVDRMLAHSRSTNNLSQDAPRPELVRALLALTWADPGAPLFSAEHCVRHPTSEPISPTDTRELIRTLNALYQRQAPLWERDSHPASFTALPCQIISDSSTTDTAVFAFARTDSYGGTLVVVTNLTAEPHSGVSLSLPNSGSWQVLLNTDDERFGGDGGGPREKIATLDAGETLLAMPAYATVWLRLQK